MSNVIDNLLWGVIGAVIGVGVEHLIIKCLIPFYFSCTKAVEIRKKRKLYYSDKTNTCIRDYYGNLLFNCKIGHTSKQVPFVVKDEWSKLYIDAFAEKNILQPVETDKCTYPLHRKMIHWREKRGQRLFNQASHFLHRVVYNEGKITFEIGEYEYFQRISFVHDFEKETYSWIHKGMRDKTVLRQKYLPVPSEPSLLSPNTVPIGCDAVIAILRNGKYYICIHERSDETVNYPGGVMVTPTFGLEHLNHIDIDNPLLFAFLKEYAEELYDRKEVEEVDSYISPMWFYRQYPEVADMLYLLENGKADFILNGCGFDAVGGFMNLSLLVAVHDEDFSEKIYTSCKGNWESKKNSVRFVPIDSTELEIYLKNNTLCPASAFAISRAISILEE